MRQFKKMADVLEERVTDKFRLEKFSVSETQARLHNIMAKHGRSFIDPGEYVRLMETRKHGWREVVMSDTPYEQRTNLDFMLHAKGDILIAGLGIGLILLPLFETAGVTSITVVEKHESIIQMILPQLLPYAQKSYPLPFRVFHADIESWLPPVGARYQTIYFDIWNDVCGDNWPQMKRLHKRFRKYLAKGIDTAWIGSWEQDECRYQHKEDSRYG